MGSFKGWDTVQILITMRITTRSLVSRFRASGFSEFRLGYSGSGSLNPGFRYSLPITAKTSGRDPSGPGAQRKAAGSLKGSLKRLRDGSRVSGFRVLGVFLLF